MVDIVVIHKRVVNINDKQTEPCMGSRSFLNIWWKGEGADVESHIVEALGRSYITAKNIWPFWKIFDHFLWFTVKGPSKGPVLERGLVRIPPDPYVNMELLFSAIYFNPNVDVSAYICVYHLFIYCYISFTLTFEISFCCFLLNMILMLNICLSVCSYVQRNFYFSKF